MEPLVSINCITYNHAPFIKEALDGFIMQKTNFPFEVVLHDDASTDGTQDIIREYERAYPDIFNVIYQKENQTQKGVRITREYQAPRIRGKYAAICEGDDYWFDPNKLQMQADYMEKHPDCSCSYHPTLWFDYTEGGRVLRSNQQALKELDFDGRDIFNRLSISTCSMFYRTSISKSYPKFRQIADIADFPLKCLLAAHGYYHYFPQVMSVYRWSHATSWNRKFFSDKKFALKNALRALHWLYEFNLYSKGKFESEVGQTMMYYITARLDAIDAVSEFRWIEDIVIEAHGKKDEQLEFKKLWESTGNRVYENKFKAAEKEFYSWFVNRIGEDIDKLP